MVVGDGDLPPAGRCVAGHRDVAAEADQHPAVDDRGDPGRGPVGGERLGGGAQVETDTGRDEQLTGVGVVPQPPGAGRGLVGIRRGQVDRARPSQDLDRTPPMSRSYPRAITAAATVGSTR